MRRREIKKFGIILGMVVLGLIIICCLGLAQNKNINSKAESLNFNVKEDSLEYILNNAEEVTIEKKILSLKKKYYIKVDDVLVGEVTGKFITAFGDKLTMTDVNGNVVKSEYQIKRLGLTQRESFNVSLDRLAEIVDANDVTTGYIGEEKIKDLFKLKHTQYFYDSSKTKIGSAEPSRIFLCKDYDIFDTEGNIVYRVDGNIFSLSNKSTIYKTGESEIEMADVIFYTIIENSIIDSKTSSSDSSSQKKN